jgi:signal recognition particle GTPase
VFVIHLYRGHGNMNVYVNLKPNNYDGESDLLTVEVPASYTEELLRHVRPIAEQKNINEDKILKDIIKEAVLEIERRNYERKNRSSKKR